MARPKPHGTTQLFRRLRIASAAALVLVSLVIGLGAGGVPLPFGGELWMVGVFSSAIFTILHWTGRAATRVVGVLGGLAGLAAIPLHLFMDDPGWVRGAVAVAGVIAVLAIAMEFRSRDS